MRINTPKTTTATNKSNKKATSRISGIPAATTKLASETPFSREKKPMAWLTTSRRTIIRMNATKITATDRLSAAVGSTAEWMPSTPTAEKAERGHRDRDQHFVCHPQRAAASDLLVGFAQQAHHQQGYHDNFQRQRKDCESIQFRHIAAECDDCGQGADGQ